MKKCSKCGELQPFTEFYVASHSAKRRRNPGTGYHSWCRTCSKAASKAWHYSERGQKMSKRHMRNRTLFRKYGVTEEWYNAQYAKQNGLCLICSDPKRSSDEPLVVDHCHQTGIVRGLLCRWCNLALGFLGEDPYWLNCAWLYLAHHQHKIPVKIPA